MALNLQRSTCLSLSSVAISGVLLVYVGPGVDPKALCLVGKHQATTPVPLSSTLLVVLVRDDLSQAGEPWPSSGIVVDVDVGAGSESEAAWALGSGFPGASCLGEQPALGHQPLLPDVNSASNEWLSSSVWEDTLSVIKPIDRLSHPGTSCLGKSEGELRKRRWVEMGGRAGLRGWVSME